MDIFVESSLNVCSSFLVGLPLDFELKNFYFFYFKEVCGVDQKFKKNLLSDWDTNLDPLFFSFCMFPNICEVSISVTRSNVESQPRAAARGQ